MTYNPCILIQRVNCMKLKWAILFTAFLLAIAAPQAGAQTERTLAGEWIMVSSPINGENFSRLGNSLGFPDRDMVFTQEEACATASSCVKTSALTSARSARGA